MANNEHPKSVLTDELDRFSKTAHSWWQTNGSYKVLHKFNQARLQFIYNTLKKYHINLPNTTNTPILDVACGGGLLSEPLTKLGFNVTGIDASLVTINVAKEHAQKSSLQINYLNKSLEQYIADNPTVRFPIVFAMEIIEHVKDPKDFMDMLLSCLSKDGLLFISTINKNLQSLLLAKLAAEYVLRWVPRNTHKFSKFVTPKTLQSYAHPSKITDIAGINYSIFSNKWSVGNDTNVNYIVCIKKI